MRTNHESELMFLRQKMVWILVRLVNHVNNQLSRCAKLHWESGTTTLISCRAKDTVREGQHRGWDGSVSTRTRGCAVLTARPAVSPVTNPINGDHPNLATQVDCDELDKAP